MILSLDPSTKITGAAIFSASGKRLLSADVIRPDKPSAPAIERVHQMAYHLRHYISEVVTEHGERISVAVIEKPYVAQNAARSAVGAQFYAIGTFYHVLRSLDVARIDEVSPSTWTKNKSKEHRALWIRREYKIPAHQDPGNDAVDAIGLGVYWVAENRGRLAAKVKG